MKQVWLLIGTLFLVTSGTGAGTEDMGGGLCLWYDQPATSWMTEALPIGNGPMGAMLFGGTTSAETFLPGMTEGSVSGGGGSRWSGFFIPPSK